MSVLQTSAREDHKKNKNSKAAPRSSLLSGPHVAKRIQCHVEQALVYGNSEPQDHEGRRFPKARQQCQPPRGGYIGCIGGRNNFVGIFSLL